LRWTLLALIALMTMGGGLAAPAPAHAATYGPVTTISVPESAPGNGATAFGMAWLDPTTQQYFVADRANRAVDIVNAASRTYVGRIGGFANAPTSSLNGPNALVAVPARNELWATDSDGTVKVIDLPSASIVDSIPTGSTKRADQIAYNPDDNVVLVTNDQDSPPSGTVVSVLTRTVVGRITFSDATNGLGQVAYDRTGRQFLVAVRASISNPGGEINSIDLGGMRIHLVFPLMNCNPHGLAMGPAQRFIVGCAATTNGPLTTLLMNARSGQVISTLPQVGGVGGVTYSASTNKYYVAAVDMTTTAVAGGPAQPVLGIISGDTNTWLGNVPLPSAVSHPLQAITVNPITEEIYLPLQNGTIQVVKDQGGVGGEGLAMTVAGGDRFIVLTWQGGTTQTGYSLVRMGATTGITLLPVAAAATNTVDRVPDADRVVCYQLVANTASGPPGLSDALCAFPDIASGQSPISFGIQLNQSSLASIYWTIGPAPNSYVLAPLGTPRAEPLRNGTVAVVDNTGGAVTCYALISITGSQPVGFTDIVCGIPGRSNLTGPTGSLTATQTQASMRVVAETLESLLPR